MVIGQTNLNYTKHNILRLYLHPERVVCVEPFTYELSQGSSYVKLRVIDFLTFLKPTAVSSLERASIISLRAVRPVIASPPVCDSLPASSADPPGPRCPLSARRQLTNCSNYAFDDGEVKWKKHGGSNAGQCDMLTSVSSAAARHSAPASYDDSEQQRKVQNGQNVKFRDNEVSSRQQLSSLVTDS
ncbi:hypothetical protein F2P81_021693 [Scophthalmus maximus]|uniref:Uncharacterized protein n=1 Tax=Scophthalmus maximus TaxID=52904 RepID=A0A6A4RW18_SCOMX|nr:hypothetical protein F2P81_021693 [Scophthalmus maximus]